MIHAASGSHHRLIAVCFAQIMKEGHSKVVAEGGSTRKSATAAKLDALTPQTSQKPNAAERIGITRPR